MSFYRGPGGSGSGDVTTTPIPINQGGTNATNAADARSNLGVSATGQDTNYAFRANNLSDLNSSSTARTNLGLGTIATQDASNVSITGGSVAGITDLAVADGGTGASTANAALNNLLPSQATASGKYLKSNGTDASWDDLDISTADITGTLPIANGGTGATSASAARTALGLAIGTDVQAYDPQLADVAGLTPTDNNFIVGNGTNFVTESGSTARTSLGLGSIATQNASNVNITGGSITGITDLAVADGGTGASTLTGYVKGNGTSAFTASSTIPNTDITGLGTMSTQAASNVSITGGSVTGITDLAIADGGTGASTAQDAINALAGAVTSGSYLRGNGTNVVMSTIQAGDVPTLNQNTTGSAASLSISGQTGLLTFTGITSTNRAKTVRNAADTILELGGSYTPTGTWNWTSATATWPTFNQNTTGTASNVTGTVAVANGGTGATTAANARIALLPSYTGNGGKVLAVNTGATDVEWVSTATGTVTSVNMTVPTGLTVSGNPVTTSGTLALTFTAGYSIPTTTKQGEWDTAYTDRLKWDGGATGLDATTGRTSLGLGSIATQNSNSVSITGGTLSGVTITAGDTGFTLQDDVDATKQAVFQLSGITTATTRTYTLPNVTGTLATISNLTQTFSGSSTFSNTFTLSQTTQNIALGTSQTTGTWTAGGASQTGTITLGQSTKAQTLNIGTGATETTTTKAINIGTSGVSGSTTTIVLGSSVSGATTTTTINGNVDITGTISGGTYA